MAEANEWANQMGRNWAVWSEALDRQLAQVLEIGLETLDPQPGEWVLDLGCGPGATTAAIAERVQHHGKVTGLDISPDLTALARARLADLAQTEIVEADAQSYVFKEPSYNALFSRFGCMFFDDPPSAFSNLRSALLPGARVVLLVWADLSENDWARVPHEIGCETLGPVDLPKPGVPGPFAWSTPDVFAPILRAGGFEEIDWRARDVRLTIGGGDKTDPFERAVDVLLHLGPLARRLNEMPEKRAEIAPRAVEGLRPYLDGDAVRMPGRIWVITARA